MQQILKNAAPQFNLTLTPAQLAHFEQYARELVAWNQKVNLTRIVAPEEIAVKHFLDSLSLCRVLEGLPPGSLLVDVGSGAGFPGLPLKLVWPHLRLTLLEATGKKTEFLSHIVRLLDLPGVTVLTARAEEAGRRPEHRERYNVAVARAVSELRVLAEYTLPLVKVGGQVVVQKGQDPAAEVRAAANALNILGGRLRQVAPVTVPGLQAARHLVIIQKIKPTPRSYPRRPGLPAKKPL